MTMKTTTKILRALAVAALLTCAAACDDDGDGDRGKDLAAGPGDVAGSPDLAVACVANPDGGEDILNACTTAQTGDPGKDHPYFPAKAAGGVLPALP
jgi:hypothetical protein